MKILRLGILFVSNVVDSKSNVPINDKEDKQYWTVFFKHDLYPGNKMILGFHKYYDIPTFRSRVRLPIKKESQPFGINIWWDPKASQASKTNGWLGNTIATKRYGLDDFCGNGAAIGEDKYCALSLQSMIKFVISKLGTNIKVISSSFAQNREEYVVEEVRKIGDKAVMCHRLNFQKVVFYCHQVAATTTYMVSLVATDGTNAKAITICHHDTRGMNPNVLYEVLKVKPGMVPVCHFVGNKAITWIPNTVE